MHVFKTSGLIGLLLFMSVSLVTAQNEVSILTEKDIRALNNEISGERAQDYIRYIGQFDRLQPSRGYHRAAEWMVAAAKKAGLSDVHIEEYPSDGKIYYYMDKTAPAWDVDFAELWIVEPKEEKLTTYAEIPVSLAITSRSCDVKGELVFVGSGTSVKDYADLDVKGKIVLAEGYIGSVANMAVDRFGALGVVVINQRYAHEEPDIVSSIRIRTKTPTFGFGLSHRRGEELKSRLQRGEKLIVRATVETEIHPWPLENVVAVIPGTSLAHEEIVLTAHLCHYKPGANDNGSGSACILELGRALKRLIDQGKIKQPKRTIRFLWVPENSGSIAYAAAHPDIMQRTVAGINMDMVGQYLNDNNSTFFLHLTPHSKPHYINDLLVNLTEFVAHHNVSGLMGGASFPVHSLSGSRDAFRYRIQGYTGGSDQWAFNAGLIDVPMVFFLIWPDHYYHTSGDKPEICDPTQLKRSAFLGAAAVVYLMDDCPHKARRLTGEMFTRAQARIARETKRSFDYLNQAPKNKLAARFKESQNFIEQAYKREVAALLSVKDYSPRDQAVDKYAQDMAKILLGKKAASRQEIKDFYHLTCAAREVEPLIPLVTQVEKKAAREIPQRNPKLRGPFSSSYLREKLAGSGINLDLPIFRTDSRICYEILNFINGKNSILEIRDAVSAEFEPVPLSWVKEFISVLEQADILLQ